MVASVPGARKPVEPDGEQQQQHDDESDLQVEQWCIGLAGLDLDGDADVEARPASARHR
jgi:hypothetical protein